MKTGLKLRHKGTQVRRHVKHVEYKGTWGAYISTLANDLDQMATFSFNPWGLWGLGILFGNGLMKCNKTFLNIIILSELRKIVSSLFYSLMTDGKKYSGKIMLSA